MKRVGGKGNGPKLKTIKAAQDRTKYYIRNYVGKNAATVGYVSSVSNGIITPDNIEPNPKNPIIASFFRNIGYVDQLGSCVRNLFKYSTYYSGKEPEFREGDIFRIIVPLDAEMVGETTQGGGQGTTQATQHTTQDATQGTPQADMDLSDIVISIIDQIRINPSVSQSKIAENLGCKVDNIIYYVKRLKDKKVLSREGSQQKGHWVVNLEKYHRAGYTRRADEEKRLLRFPFSRKKQSRWSA